MENILLHRLAGGTIPLNSFEHQTTVTKAEQRKELMGVDTIVMTVRSFTPMSFYAGDYITVFGEQYTLNSLPKVVEGADGFYYDLVFEGVLYELRNAQYRDQDISGFATSSTFDYQCTIGQAVALIVTNANRSEGSEVWFYNIDSDSASELKNFANENCLSVLQRLCSEWKKEFYITQEDGAKTIHIVDSVGQSLSYSFEYGREGGLFEFTREYVADTRFTRLYAEGSQQNIPSTYRNYSRRLKLPLLAYNSATVYQKGQKCSYLGTTYEWIYSLGTSNKLPTNTTYWAVSNDDSRIQLSGITRHIEATKYFDDIKPEREGTISALGDNVFEFVDSGMDFDLMARVDGETTYLVAGNSAIVHFNTGGLAGYEFEILSYDHATKKFKIKEFADERGNKFPHATNAAFQMGINDKYVILNINLPQSYITAAENRLLAAAQTYFDNGTKQKAQFTIKVSEMFLQRQSGISGTTRVFECGDTVNVKSSRLGVDTNIRVQSFVRDVLNPYAYTLSLSDEVTVSIAQQLIEATDSHEKTISFGQLNDIGKQRRNWRTTEELVSMVETVQAEAILIGNDPSGQFQLTESVVFKPNYQTDINSFYASGGQLAHNYYLGATDGIWTISALTGADDLDSGVAFYLYVKASRTAGTAVYWLSETKIEALSDPNYYYFPVGILSSVINGARTFQATKGFTLITGDSIKTGRIANADESLIIDLDNKFIQGLIKFAASANSPFTTVDGGLILTQVLKMLNGSTESAGMAAKTDTNNVALWAGGTLAQAQMENPESNFGVTHSGNVWLKGIIEALSGGKIGGFNIHDNSLISGSMEFSEEAVELLADLLTPIPVTISHISSWENVWTTALRENQKLPTSTQNIVLANSSLLKFKVKARTSYVTRELSLNVFVKNSADVVVHSERFDLSLTYDTHTISAFLPSGTYYISAYIEIFHSRSFAADLAILGYESDTIITANGSPIKTKIGNDGFYTFMSAMSYLYFSESNGFSIKGDTDISGVLASGSVSVSGSTTNHTNTWGSKCNTGYITHMPGSNTYIVYHTAGSNYTVQLTGTYPDTIVSLIDKSNNQFTVQTNINNASFDYAIIGSN